MSEQINSPNYVVCNCQHCNGHIEFDANELAEENFVVPCPHCGLGTKIGRFPKGTRLAITSQQNELPEGKDLIALLLEIEKDGFVSEAGVQRLHEWLEKRENSEINAILYLLDLSKGILSCGKVTMDNRFEMQMAIERVLPKHLRGQVVKKRLEIENQLPAGEGLLAHIRELGGNPEQGITREEAFELVEKLRDSATENQIAYIRRLGGNPWPLISFQEASDLIGKLLHSVKATVNQMQFIRDLGGNPPIGLSRADAEILIPQLLEKQRESLAKEQSPTPRQMMVLRFWNKIDLMQSSKWEIEQWLTKFYDEDSRRRKAWELFKAETEDDGSQHDPSCVPLGAGKNYLKRVN